MTPYWRKQAALFCSTYREVHSRQVMARFNGTTEQFVRDYQAEHDLKVDGAAGSASFAHLLNMCWPVTNVGSRTPIVTQGTRAGHDAADIAFWAVDGDPRNRLRYLLEGGREYAFPEESIIVAMADGIVTKAHRIKTGFWCWVGHANGWQTMYFHGSELLVKVGQLVERAQPIMEEGHDPRHGDNLIHLHGEVMIDGSRESMVPLLKHAQFVERCDKGRGR